MRYSLFYRIRDRAPYSFQATYSTSTNHIAKVVNSPATYDSDGNVTNDTFHTYAWDADGHAITVDAGQSDAVSLAYDALGRMVEQNRSGSYTQIVYAPSGEKLALMNGTTLQKAMVQLPGKGFAVYSSAGLQYYAHPDFLGSIRLATTSGQAIYFDTAYAPFGEPYAWTGSLDPAYTGQMNDTAHRQDTAGGLYDFPLREYSTQGRWPNPDPLGKAAACPNDPQTQNRYAYVRDNPMSYVDPLGAQPCNPSVDPFCYIFCLPGDPLCHHGGEYLHCDPFIHPGCMPWPLGINILDEGLVTKFTPGVSPESPPRQLNLGPIAALGIFRGLEFGGGSGHLWKDWTDPFACARDTADVKHCDLCCTSANVAHGAVCGLLALLPPPWGEGAAIVCEHFAAEWAAKCATGCHRQSPR